MLIGERLFSQRPPLPLWTLNRRTKPCGYAEVRAESDDVPCDPPSPWRGKREGARTEIGVADLLL